jgi:hypothetical protein
MPTGQSYCIANDLGRNGIRIKGGAVLIGAICRNLSLLVEKAGNPLLSGVALFAAVTGTHVYENSGLHEAGPAKRRSPQTQ